MIKIIIFIVIAIAIIGGGVYYNRRIDDEAQRQAALDQQNKAAAEQKLLQEEMSKLKISDLVAGTGAEAKNGDIVSINYVGTLLNGKEFDSSYKRNQPFEFPLGLGQVIKGFDLGLLGMKVGGKRSIVIPPELGYGSQSLPAIPPNSTLKFTAELLSVRPAGAR